MQLRQFFTDDDAVSPVIGVILMVAITVILAAVIGAFVLGFGGGGPSAPSVTWETSENATWGSNNGSIDFEHGGGDTITDADDVLTYGGDADDWNTSGGEPPAEMSTGDVATMDYSDGAEEVALVWDSPDGDSTQELASHNI